MAERQDPKTYVNNLVVDTKALVNDTMALAQAEVKPMAKHAGIGGGMFGGAGYLAANAASLLFLAGGLGFGLLLAHLAGWGVIASVALGFVIMAVLLLVIAGIMALLGKKQLSKIGKPTATIQEVGATVDTVKRSLKGGVNQVDADIRDRQGLVQAKRAAKDMESTPARPATPAAPVTRVGTTGSTSGATAAPETRI